MVSVPEWLINIVGVVLVGAIFLIALSIPVATAIGIASSFTEVRKAVADKDTQASKILAAFVPIAKLVGLSFLFIIVIYFYATSIISAFSR